QLGGNRPGVTASDPVPACCIAEILWYEHEPRRDETDQTVLDRPQCVHHARHVEQDQYNEGHKGHEHRNDDDGAGYGTLCERRPSTLRWFRCQTSPLGRHDYGIGLSHVPVSSTLHGI